MLLLNSKSIEVAAIAATFELTQVSQSWCSTHLTLKLKETTLIHTAPLQSAQLGEACQ